MKKAPPESDGASRSLRNLCSAIAGGTWRGRVKEEAPEGYPRGFSALWESPGSEPEASTRCVLGSDLEGSFTQYE
jgi:hypothetical protein